jgi:hypothetical protein
VEQSPSLEFILLAIVTAFNYHWHNLNYRLYLTHSVYDKLLPKSPVIIMGSVGQIQWCYISSAFFFPSRSLRTFNAICLRPGNSSELNRVLHLPRVFDKVWFKIS